MCFVALKLNTILVKLILQLLLETLNAKLFRARRLIKTVFYAIVWPLNLRKDWDGSGSFMAIQSEKIFFADQSVGRSGSSLARGGCVARPGIHAYHIHCHLQVLSCFQPAR